LDKATQDKLAQGERLIEVLKQPQYSPYPLEQQVAILFLAINGYLINIEVKNISVFIKSYLEYLNNNHADIMRTINETGILSVTHEGEMHAAVDKFKRLHG